MDAKEKFNAFLLEKIRQIVESDDSLVMHSETMAKLDLLCIEYDIEPELEDFEDSTNPGFWIANVIMHNELMREKQKSHSCVLETSLER